MKKKCAAHKEGNEWLMRKYISEFFGTFVLVLFGCGTAVLIGGGSGGAEAGFLGVLTIAMAFGLSIVAAAYAIGDISGCHVNPAVSLSMLILGRMSFRDFIGYAVFQVLGALGAGAVLKAIVSMTYLEVNVTGLGQNGYAAASALHLTAGGAFLVEVILTFVFVMTIIGVVSSEKTAHMGGVVIGLTLAFVHILGIPLTGTSVNPARSLAPALMLGGEALSQVWVFLLAPLVGAALAALFYKALAQPKQEI